MRLVAVAVLAIVAAIVGPPGRASAAFSAVDAVHWDPAYADRKITVTVDLGFFADCPWSQCQGADMDAANRDVTAILNAWNGHKYKCFDFIVKINYVVVATYADVPPGSLPIKLAWPLEANIPAYTVTGPHETAPGDQGSGTASQPGTDPNDPSHWPPDVDPDTFVHEFGHILGLDDNYYAAKDANGHNYGGLVPGQPNDAMYGNNTATNAFVSEQMINQAVERSGKVDTAEVKCNMTLDSGPSNVNLFVAQISDLTLHLYTCDYDLPSNDPKHPARPLHFEGYWSESGSVLTTNGSVKYPVSFDANIPVTGGPMSFALSGNGHTIAVSGKFTWSNDGLLQTSTPWSFDGETTALFSPPFQATASEGASECQ